MPENKITRIKVGNNQIGIIGLIYIIENYSEVHMEKSDDEISEILLTRLSKKNYIHSSVKDNYKTAFLREYKKYLNLPYEEEKSDEVVIRVLGQGCAQCNKLEQDLLELLSELNIPADFEHVRDAMEIAQYGTINVPALIINNKVILSGTMLPKNRIKEKLLAAI